MDAYWRAPAHRLIRVSFGRSRTPDAAQPPWEVRVTRADGVLLARMPCSRADGESLATVVAAELATQTLVDFLNRRGLIEAFGEPNDLW